MRSTMNLIRQSIFSMILYSLFIGCLYASSTKTDTAIFAGGCFWSMQHDFENLPGIISTTVGYTGGDFVNPTYSQVSSGSTGHVEAIKIVYDPAVISYEKLVDFYWHDTDPTNEFGQFCDSGSEYRPIIFYLDNQQQSIAMQSEKQLEKSKRFNTISTQILPAKTFYPAEEYHQHYSDKNPAAYHAYRVGCRRDEIRDQVWGK